MKRESVAVKRAETHALEGNLLNESCKVLCRSSFPGITLRVDDLKAANTTPSTVLHKVRIKLYAVRNYITLRMKKV